MKKVKAAIMLALFAGILFSAQAKDQKKKSIKPDGPVVATWSKIKEMFE